MSNCKVRGKLMSNSEGDKKYKTSYITIIQANKETDTEIIALEDILVEAIGEGE